MDLIDFFNGTSNDTVEESMDLTQKSCATDIPPTYYTSITGLTLVVPEWEAILTAIVLSSIILLTIVGNILVILSVFTYKPLRIVQNFFIISLAVADLTVAILVLPFNVAYSILGKWQFGIHACKMWLTCDILCCTASILNLCAIALDRYWAITDPINYAQQRTLNRVMIMIGGVWVLSAIISSPPLIGWNDWPEEEEFNNKSVCTLTQQQGYVVYSSLGSFYIPLFIMTIVYVEIFIATRRRLRERAKASKLNMVKQNVTVTNQQTTIVVPKDQQGQTSGDQDSVSSETNHNEHPRVEELPSGKTKEKKRKMKKKKNKAAEEKSKFLAPMLVMEDSITDNHESPSGSHHRNSLNHAEDGQTTTTNTESPRSRTQEVAAPPPPEVKKPVVVYQFIEEKQRISLSKERRAARTLGIIMGVFVVCWLPFFLMYVIVPFCATCCPSEKFGNFITWLGYINSALNPIIYTIFNLDFRRAFKKLLHLKP